MFKCESYIFGEAFSLYFYFIFSILEATFQWNSCKCFASQQCFMNSSFYPFHVTSCSHRFIFSIVENWMHPHSFTVHIYCTRLELMLHMNILSFAHHHLLTFKLFQTCMTFFLLLKKKGYFEKCGFLVAIDFHSR